MNAHALSRTRWIIRCGRLRSLKPDQILFYVSCRNSIFSIIRGEGFYDALIFLSFNMRGKRIIEDLGYKHEGE